MHTACLSQQTFTLHSGNWLEGSYFVLIASYEQSLLFSSSSVLASTRSNCCFAIGQSEFPRAAGEQLMFSCRELRCVQNINTTVRCPTCAPWSVCCEMIYPPLWLDLFSIKSRISSVVFWVVEMTFLRFDANGLRCDCWTPIDWLAYIAIWYVIDVELLVVCIRKAHWIKINLIYKIFIASGTVVNISLSDAIKVALSDSLLWCICSVGCMEFHSQHFWLSSAPLFSHFQSSYLGFFSFSLFTTY